MAILGASSKIISGTGRVLSGMVQGVAEVGSILAALPFRLHFILIWLLGFLYLLFNAESIYGAQASRQQILLLFYMASLAFVYSQTHRSNPLMGISAGSFLLMFGFYFAIGAFALSSFGPLVPSERPFLTRESVGTLITHAWVVAIGEELLFRNAIPSLIPAPPLAAQTLSAAAFAWMHWTAYGGSIPNVIFAGILGLFFGAITIRVRNGIVIAMALHFAYNAYVLGYIT